MSVNVRLVAINESIVTVPPQKTHFRWAQLFFQLLLVLLVKTFEVAIKGRPSGLNGSRMDSGKPFIPSSL